MLEILIISVATGAFIGIICIIFNLNKKGTLKKVISQTAIADDMIFYQDNGQKALVIDEEKATLAIYTYLSNSKIHKYIIGVKDIVSFEILENNNSLVSVNRGSQLGGAIVGGVLLGGVGAIIGGLSGSKRQDEYCNSIKIKFVFNDLKNKTDEIFFLRGIDKKGYKKNSFIYNAAFKQAEKFYDTLCILMKNEELSSIEIVNEEISI